MSRAVKQEAIAAIVILFFICSCMKAEDANGYSVCLAEDILAEKVVDLEMINNQLKGEHVRLQEKSDEIIFRMEHFSSGISVEHLEKIAQARQTALDFTQELLDEISAIFEREDSYASRCVLTRKLEHVEQKQDVVIDLFQDLKHFVSWAGLYLVMREIENDVLVAGE